MGRGITPTLVYCMYFVFKSCSALKGVLLRYDDIAAILAMEQSADVQFIAVLGIELTEV